MASEAQLTEAIVVLANRLVLCPVLILKRKVAEERRITEEKKFDFVLCELCSSGFPTFETTGHLN